MEDYKRKVQPDQPPALLVCGHCDSVCEVDAIDFDMPPEEFELDVGAVLVAVGFQEFDARKLGNYGYGRFPNVLTAMEMERLANSAGPTAGNHVEQMVGPRQGAPVSEVGRGLEGRIAIVGEEGERSPARHHEGVEAGFSQGLLRLLLQARDVSGEQLGSSQGHHLPGGAAPRPLPGASPIMALE